MIRNHPDLENLFGELILQPCQRLDNLVTISDLIDLGYTLEEIFSKKNVKNCVHVPKA